MGRLIKYLFYLGILCVIVLVGYSFFGDLSARKTTITIPVEAQDG